MAYECILLKPALRFLDKEAKPEERKPILEIIESICSDPHIDGKTKFYFPALPVVLTLCKLEEWWIIYYRADPTTIHIVNIGRVPERPHIHRSS